MCTRIIYRLLLTWSMTLALGMSCVDGLSEEMARIEGTHYKDGKPAPGEIILHYSESPELNKKPNIVHVGDDGKFVFESVRPQELTVGRYVSFDLRTKQTSTRASMCSHGQTVFPRPGETLHLDIGRNGRTVKGQLVAKGNTNVEVAWEGGSSRFLQSDIEWPTPPKNIKEDELQAWRTKFRTSDEGKALLSQMRTFIVDVGADGSFSVSDIPPGKYSLWIEVGDANASELGMPIGEASAKVVVPDDQESTPIDLGEVDVEIYKQLHVGDIAPEFEVPGLDGKPISLAALKGKYVLLDFWATWCGPCVAEIPHMKSVYERFKDHPNFVMVALSLDPERSTLSKFLEKEGIGWAQGFLGEWSDTKLPDEYGVRGIPAIFLIGPDGNILATDLRGETIAETVANALGK